MLQCTSTLKCISEKLVKIIFLLKPLWPIHTGTNQARYTPKNRLPLLSTPHSVVQITLGQLLSPIPYVGQSQACQNTHLSINHSPHDPPPFLQAKY